MIEVGQSWLHVATGKLHRVAAIIPWLEASGGIEPPDYYKWRGWLWVAIMSRVDGSLPGDAMQLGAALPNARDYEDTGHILCYRTRLGFERAAPEREWHHDPQWVLQSSGQ